MCIMPRLSKVKIWLIVTQNRNFEQVSLQISAFFYKTCLLHPVIYQNFVSVLVSLSSKVSILLTAKNAGFFKSHNTVLRLLLG